MKNILATIVACVALLSLVRAQEIDFGYLIKDPRWFFKSGNCIVCPDLCDSYEDALEDLLAKDEVIAFYNTAFGACAFEDYVKIYRDAYTARSQSLQTLYQNVKRYLPVGTTLVQFGEKLEALTSAVLYKYETALQDLEAYIRGFDATQFCTLVHSLNNALIELSQYRSHLSTEGLIQKVKKNCPHTDVCDLLQQNIDSIEAVEIPEYDAFDASFTPQTYEAYKELVLKLSHEFFDSFATNINSYISKINNFFDTSIERCIEDECLTKTGAEIMVYEDDAKIVKFFGKEIEEFKDLLEEALPSISVELTRIANSEEKVREDTFRMPQIGNEFASVINQQSVVSVCTAAVKYNFLKY